jgi:hypothetical protein
MGIVPDDADSPPAGCPPPGYSVGHMDTSELVAQNEALVG